MQELECYGLERDARAWVQGFEAHHLPTDTILSPSLLVETHHTVFECPDTVWQHAQSSSSACHTLIVSS
jgi:hypothetical protein